MIYAVINTTTKVCENVIKWDGVSLWGPPEGTIAQQSNEIQIGDECELVDGVWQKVIEG